VNAWSQTSGPGAGFTIHATTASPRHDLIAQFYAYGDDHEIWIRSAADPADGRLLARYGQDASVLFSPDESAIALNEEEDARVFEVRLFRRDADTHYEQPPGPPPADVAWDLYARLHGLDGPPEHNFAKAVRWSPDSGQLQLVLWGDDAHVTVREWPCVYTVRTGQVSEGRFFQ
jgi:hypothetical protein